MKTRITVICENSAPLSSSNIIAEHGLSFFIESEDNTLFDTGQGLGIINNLSVLKKDINSIQRIILSHGHYDHTGGLLQVLGKRAGKTPVFLHPAAFNGKYAHEEKNNILAEKNIGMGYSREVYEKAGAGFNFINGYYPVAGSVYAISEIKRPPGWKGWDPRLKQKAGGITADDPFMDDLSLLIETGSGPVVLLGCAHAGLVEILNDISFHSGHKEYHAVIGGTHLANAPEDYLEKAIETLKFFNVKLIAPAHCSGFSVESLFASRFKKEFARASAGTVFEF